MFAIYIRWNSAGDRLVWRGQTDIRPVLGILVQVRDMIGSFVAVVQAAQLRKCRTASKVPCCDVIGGSMAGLISSETITVCCPGRRTPYYYCSRIV